MDWITQMEIWFLKRKAKGLYIQMVDIASKYDCGRELLSEISDDYAHIEREFNRTIKRLKLIDRNFSERGLSNGYS